MELAVPRQLAPVDLGSVVVLHAAVFAAMLVARVDPAPPSATAPIMAEIVQAPAAAPATPRAGQPQRLPPLAMRTPPRRQSAQKVAQPTKTKPLTSATPRATREVATARPKSAAPPLPRVTPPLPAPAPVAPVAEPTPTPAPVQAAASAPAVASSAAATAPTAAAERTAGSTGSPRDNRAYLATLLQQLNRFKVYPPALRKAKVEGRVVLTFTIDAQGRVTFSDVQKTSGHSALDDAAARMLARASPLPAIPPSMGKDSLTLSVPIEYSLRTDR